MSSGPLARSAHMRMKMKKRNEAHSYSHASGGGGGGYGIAGGTTSSSVVAAAANYGYSSPGTGRVGVDAVVGGGAVGASATAATSPARSPANNNAKGNNTTNTTISNTAIMGGAASRRGIYGGINSLHTSEEDHVVDNGDNATTTIAAAAAAAAAVSPSSMGRGRHGGERERLRGYDNSNNNYSHGQNHTMPYYNEYSHSQSQYHHSQPQPHNHHHNHHNHNHHNEYTYESLPYNNNKQHNLESPARTTPNNSGAYYGSHRPSPRQQQRPASRPGRGHDDAFFVTADTTTDATTTTTTVVVAEEEAFDPFAPSPLTVPIIANTTANTTAIAAAAKDDNDDDDNDDDRESSTPFFHDPVFDPHPQHHPQPHPYYRDHHPPISGSSRMQPPLPLPPPPSSPREQYPQSNNGRANKPRHHFPVPTSYYASHDDYGVIVDERSNDATNRAPDDDDDDDALLFDSDVEFDNHHHHHHNHTNNHNNNRTNNLNHTNNLNQIDSLRDEFNDPNNEEEYNTNDDIDIDGYNNNDGDDDDEAMENEEEENNVVLGRYHCDESEIIINPEDDHPVFHYHKKKHASHYYQQQQQQQKMTMNDHDFEYHAEKDEASFDQYNDNDIVGPLVLPTREYDGGEEETTTTTNTNEDVMTIDSERALYGTPVRKKKNSHRHSSSSSSRKKQQKQQQQHHRSSSSSKKEKEALFIIHNVGSEDSVENAEVAQRDPRYAIHYTGSQEEEEEGMDGMDRDGITADERLSAKYRRNRQYHDSIAAHARRFAVEHSASAEMEEEEDPVGATAALTTKGEEEEEEEEEEGRSLGGTPARPFALHGRVRGSPQSSANDTAAAVPSPRRRPVRAEDATTTTDDSRKVFLPRRMGGSKSWDNTDDSVQRINSSKSWDATSEMSGGHNIPQANKGASPRRIGNKQKTIWNIDEYDDEENDPLGGGSATARNRHQFIGASKSWDRDDRAWQGSQPSNQFGTSDPSPKELFHRDDAADENALAEWDKAEAEWHKKASSPEKEKVVSNKIPAFLDKKNHPWRSGHDGNIPMQFDTSQSKEDLSDYDDNDDDDSIFVFEKQQKQQQQQQHQQELETPLQTDPADIFQKITSGLEQAGKKKSRALGKEDSKEGIAETANVASAMAENTNRVAFAGKGENTIHTYLIPKTTDEETAESFDANDDDNEEDDDYDGNDEEEEGEEEEDEELSVPRDGNNRSQHEQRQDSGEKDSVSRKKIAGGDSLNKKSAISKKHRKYSVETEDDYDQQEFSDGDVDTIGDSTYGGSTKSARSGAYERDEGDMGLLDHVAFVATSLGDLILGKPIPREQPRRRSAAEDDGSMVSDRYDDDTNAMSTVPSQYTGYTGTTGYTGQSDQPKGDWLSYMEHVLFPSEAEVNNNDQSVVTESEGQTTKWSDDEDEYDDDDDAYLLQQALAAARAVHHVAGIEYNETQEIDVLKDVKFVVVTVLLPLGLLFQEHEIGVWVSRVVPDGNGAKNGVQHGDQLAAINGKSSVHASIDEVASTISSTPNNSGVELTFLRYTGPLCPVPGAVIQEGFEVTDTSLNAKPKSPKSKHIKSAVQKAARRKSKTAQLQTPPSSPGRRSVNAADKSAHSPKTPTTPVRSEPSSPRTPMRSQPNSPRRSKPNSPQSSPNRATVKKEKAALESPSRPKKFATTTVVQEDSAPKVTKKKSLVGKFLPFKKKK